MTKVYMRVGGGGMTPADATQASLLNSMKIKNGDVLTVDVKLIRSGRFNNLVHKIGELVAQNIEQFTGLDAHTTIKRLQLEGCIECDIVAIQLDGYGLVEQRIPRSIAFDRMSEVRYREAAQAICELVQRKYWQGLDEHKIERMAELFVNGTHV